LLFVVAEPLLRRRLPTPLVKICGLREPEHARAAALAGADLLGFLFAPSKRRIDAETARVCIAAAREVARDDPFIAVGVFANATAEEMNDVAEVAGLDLLQIHGNQDATIGSRLRRPFYTAVHPSPGISVDEVGATLAAHADATKPPIAFMIDGYHAERPGGQGIRADWGLAHVLARSWPIVLAGGLNAENVGEAIRTVMPIGVDVSSGVETDGRKDVEKIEAFVRAARRGFDKLTQTEG
jgi:phosphoribosylanthranilate isomerase